MRFDPGIFGLSHMPEKSGFPAGVRGIAVADFARPCAEITDTINATANSVKRFIKPLRLRLQTFHRREHATAVGERHRVARSVERSVFRAVALHDDLVAGLHCTPADAATLQHAWRSARESP